MGQRKGVRCAGCHGLLSTVRRQTIEEALAVHQQTCPSHGFRKAWVEEAPPEPSVPEPVKVIKRRVVKRLPEK